MSLRFSTWWIFLVAGGLLAAGVWAYAPGLHGGFLFDDFGNLPALGANGPVDNWATFLRYITSGAADPTGRPVALLSFLVDARDWPASPYAFKRTNLLLHLVNGVLLAFLLRHLGHYGASTAGQRQRNDLAAMLGAAMWLLHPLLVSTTLYIVQREAMLPATFTLVGLLLWLSGRDALMQHRLRWGMALIVAGLCGCTLLGVLSKANGILLPALALTIEYAWLRSQSSHSPLTKPTSRKARELAAYHYSMLLFGWLPSLIVVGYLVYAGWAGFAHGVSALRPWTMGQRLITEPRVMMDYLDLLWAPRPFTPGLFNDQVRASISIWSPATTLPALLAVAGLIVGACVLRRRWPAFAMAILFYFTGQLLESTTLQLELYFEHRNYLPAMLMFWPLALWLCGVRTRRSPGFGAGLAAVDSKRVDAGSMLKVALAAVLLGGLALMTHARAALWGDTHDQALLWAKLNPDSARAQANAALLEMAAGNPKDAVTRLSLALPASPDQVQLSFNLIGAHCMLGKVPATDLERARLAISNTRDPGSLLVHWFDSSIEAAEQRRCQGLDLSALESLLDAGLANHKLVDVDGRHQDLLYLKAHIALSRNHPLLALSYFNAALDQNVRPGAALNQAAMLGAAGFPNEGLAHLDHYELNKSKVASPSSGMPWLHAKVLQQQNYWPMEFKRLRRTLQQDAQAKAPDTR